MGRLPIRDANKWIFYATWLASYYPLFLNMVTSLGVWIREMGQILHVIWRVPGKMRCTFSSRCSCSDANEWHDLCTMYLPGSKRAGSIPRRVFGREEVFSTSCWRRFWSNYPNGISLPIVWRYVFSAKRMSRTSLSLCTLPRDDSWTNYSQQIHSAALHSNKHLTISSIEGRRLHLSSHPLFVWEGSMTEPCSINYSL